MALDRATVDRLAGRQIADLMQIRIRHEQAARRAEKKHGNRRS